MLFRYRSRSPAAAAQQDAQNHALRWNRSIYTYDTHGRLTRKRTASGDEIFFAWNREQQLVQSWSERGGEWTYHYDALGRRIAKERHENGDVVEETGASALLIDRKIEGGSLWARLNLLVLKTRARARHRDGRDTYAALRRPPGRVGLRQGQRRRPQEVGNGLGRFGASPWHHPDLPGAQGRVGRDGRNAAVIGFRHCRRGRQQGGCEDGSGGRRRFGKGHQQQGRSRRRWRRQRIILSHRFEVSRIHTDRYARLIQYG